MLQLHPITLPQTQLKTKKVFTLHKLTKKIKTSRKRATLHQMRVNRVIFQRGRKLLGYKPDRIWSITYHFFFTRRKIMNGVGRAAQIEYGTIFQSHFRCSCAINFPRNPATNGRVQLKWKAAFHGFS